MSAHKRSIKNAFVQPEFSMKLSLYYIVIGGLMITAVGGLVMQKLSGVQDLMNRSPQMDYQIQSQVNDLMLQCVQISLMGFSIFILFSFVFALTISFRISGPQVAIKAYIEQLKLGNYDYERNLRPNDELTAIMTALKELKPVLVERDKATKD